MPQPTLIQVAAHMVAEVTGRGQTPLCFLMNADTANRLADDLQVEAKRRMSALERLRHSLRKKGPAKLTHLCGVPITEAPHIPPGGLFLQVFQPIVPQQPQPGVPAEFVKREPVPAHNSETAPTLSDIASGSTERPSVSSVLIEAMSGADSLDSVVVIRAHKNQSVDMCTNCDSFALRGVLQKAHEYMLMRGL
jgi:hypothetical protein